MTHIVFCCSSNILVNLRIYLQTHKFALAVEEEVAVSIAAMPRSRECVFQNGHRLAG